MVESTEGTIIIRIFASTCKPGGGIGVQFLHNYVERVFLRGKAYYLNFTIFEKQKLMNCTYPELFVRLTCHNEGILVAVLLRIKERLVRWVTAIVTENTCVLM